MPKATSGIKLVIAGVIVCLLAIFATSVGYRMLHPSLQVVSKQSGGGGMPGGMSGGMGAVQELMNNVKANPNDFGARVELGNAFIMMRAWDRAIEHLTVANTIKPGEVHVLKSLGISMYHKGDFANALGTYKAILTKQPDDALALYNVGVIYRHALKNDGEAATYFKKLLEVHKHDDELRKDTEKELKEMGLL